MIKQHSRTELKPYNATPRRIKGMAEHIAWYLRVFHAGEQPTSRHIEMAIESFINPNRTGK
jgi:hypothetical protein